MNTFEIRSTQMRVTDPCYDKDTWCSGVLEDVLPGTWVAETNLSDEGPWGIRVARLIVRHQDYPAAEATMKTTIDVGVDSGQAGFFDESQYPEGSTGDFGDTDTMYGRICEGTLSETQLGIVEYGVASSSGYGDGGYDCYIGRNRDGQIVVAEIVFITDEEEDDEDDYWGDDEDEEYDV